MRPAITAGVLLALGACGPVERPEVILGEPVANVAEVSFAADVAGAGQLRLTVDGREQVIALGEPVGGRYRAVVLLPSGQSVSFRGGVEDPAGDLIEGPTKRVRIPKEPKKIRYNLGRVDTKRSQLGDGLILLNAYDDDDSYALALDNEARVRWWVQPDNDRHRILRVRPGLDGQSIVYARWAKNHKVAPDVGHITRLGLSPSASRTDTRALELHHDWVELPGGRFAWLSWVYEESLLVEGLGRVKVAADAVLVADEGAREGEEQVLYDMLVDYPASPWYPCTHMVPDGFVGGDYWEWSHSNSIDYDPQTDSVRVLARYLDAVLDIGLDGTLNWQAGGRYSDFALDGWFLHAHASELAGSQWLVFDNGNHGAEPIVSAAVGLELDLEAGVVRERFRIPDPRGKFTDFLGDARTLPGGNVLVLYSPSGLIHEYTPAGDLVWEAIPEANMTVGRLTWTDSLIPVR